MRSELLAHDARTGSGAGRKLRRVNTSVVAEAEWPEEEVDFESDSVKFLLQCEE